MISVAKKTGKGVNSMGAVGAIAPYSPFLTNMKNHMYPTNMDVKDTLILGTPYGNAPP